MVFWLPYAFDFDIQILEEYPAVKTQGPEDGLVILQTFKGNPWILEQYVLSVYVIIQLLSKEQRDVFSKGADSVTDVRVVIRGLFRPLGLWRLLL